LREYSAANSNNANTGHYLRTRVEVPLFDWSLLYGKIPNPIADKHVTPKSPHLKLDSRCFDNGTTGCHSPKRVTDETNPAPSDISVHAKDAIPSRRNEATAPHIRVFHEELRVEQPR
jgi:hypothetical protein